MRKTVSGLMAAITIVTVMSEGAMAATRHAGHPKAQVGETVRSAYGSFNQENDPAGSPWGAANSSMKPDDWRASVNGN